MSSRNLKKVIRKVILNSQEKDVTKRTFKPTDYPKNWNEVIKYMNTRDRRLTFNRVFKPLFIKIYQEDIKAYLAAGHKLTTVLKKQMREYAKEKAKELTQTKLSPGAPAQQGYKEQETVLAEG
jgi:hypothetical protein